MQFTNKLIRIKWIIQSNIYFKNCTYYMKIEGQADHIHSTDKIL